MSTNSPDPDAPTRAPAARAASARAGAGVAAAGPRGAALDRGVFDTLLDRASEQFESAPRQALALADDALAMLPPLEVGRRDEQQARVRRVRGIALHYAGRHADGLDELGRALAAVPEGDSALQTKVMRALSMGNELMGALGPSLDWARRALDAARRQDDPSLVAEALLSVGIAHSRAGDPQAGLGCFEQVLALFETQANRYGCASVLNNMGINCKNLGRHADALDYLQRGMAIAQAIGDAGASAVLRSNLGEPLLLLGRYDEARAESEAAIRELSACGFREGEIHARVLLGQVLLRLGLLDDAQAELERALRDIEGTGSMNHAARAHRTLAELHKAAGRFEAALGHQERFHAAERAQFNAESDRTISALRVQLEVADAQHEAEVHRLRHVEIARAHDDLKALHEALLAADREKTRLLERLAEQSRTDGLTGLANRRWLDERLADEIQRARRTHQPLAVAMCDLDFFKRINDRLGHPIGDEVLRRVAAVLRERCRGTDLVARYGGEEFCIAFLESDAATAARTCETLRAAVERQDWRALHPELAVTISIGISDRLDLPGAHALLADADTFLYQAKHDGKNRVRWRGEGGAPG